METAAGKQRNRSQLAFERGCEVLVGGVNSPVRAFGAVGGTPLIVDRGAGAQLWDVDGNAYLDYVCSWGALILGHAYPDVAEAIADQAKRGTSFGMTTELEIQLATMLRQALPSLERVRFVSSGTEATMSAVRLARAATGRDLILKFEGGYHGHADSFLSKAGSGLATLGIAASPGVPQSLAALTLDAPYNDLARGGARIRSASRRDRSGHRRACGSEYGRGASRQGFSGRLTGTDAKARSTTDF